MSKMSTNEINEIVGMTYEHLKQTRKELACLDCKAHEIAENLETVGKVLVGEIEGSCTGGYFIVQPPKGPKRIDWPTVQDMNDVLIQRTNLKDEIARLEEKLNQMGHTGHG